MATKRKEHDCFLSNSKVSRKDRFNGFTPLEEANMRFDASCSNLFENLSAALKGIKNVALYTPLKESKSKFSLHYASSGGATPTIANVIYPHMQILYQKGNQLVSFDFVNLPEYKISVHSLQTPDNGMEKVMIPIIKKNGDIKVKGLLVIEGVNLRFDTSKDYSIESLLTFFAQVSFKLGKRMDHMNDISGLPRRTEATEEDLANELRDSSNTSIVFIDLNKLKLINDTLGHDAGDEVIRKVGQAIKDNIIASESFAYRWGGDEFAIVLKNADATAAHHVAMRIAKAFSQQQIWASFGISTGQVSSVEELAALVRQADDATYHSKEHSREGENLITSADNGMMTMTVVPFEKPKEHSLDLKKFVPLIDEKFLSEIPC
ncbi:MAG: GGDEF domain-containing protein [Candidatus Anstonellales archaeon]